MWVSTTELYFWFAEVVIAALSKVVVDMAMAMAMAMAAMGMCVHVGVHADSVSIENEMGHGVVMGIHCTSSGIDLGFKTVYDGSTYDFSFSPGWLGRDVYECNFDVEGYPVKHMRVYEGINFFDNFCLCRSCHWKVSPQGFDCERGQYHESW